MLGGGHWQAAEVTGGGGGDDRYRRKSNCIRCNSSGDSFQNATRWMVLVSQLVGVMPLIGLSFARKSQPLRHPSFSWTAPATIYSLLLITMSLLETSLCIHQIFQSGFFFGNIGALTFYMLALVSRSLCLQLAMQWPRILHSWRHTEKIFLQLPYSSSAMAGFQAHHRRHFSLAIRVNVTFGFCMFLALGKWRVVVFSFNLTSSNLCLIVPNSGTLCVQLYPLERRAGGPGAVPVGQGHPGAVYAQSTFPLIPPRAVQSVDGALPLLVQHLLHLHRRLLGRFDNYHRLGVY